MERKRNIREVFVILHNLRSVHNVGAIFRSADAAGVVKLFLTGYTPLPMDRFGRKRPDIAKTALGAETYVAWEFRPHIGALVQELCEAGIQLVCVEQAPGARNFREFQARERVAYIFGNEVRGISSALLKRCDVIIEIPMRGRKESLNVAVAAGVILFCGG